MEGEDGDGDVVGEGGKRRGSSDRGRVRGEEGKAVPLLGDTVGGDGTGEGDERGAEEIEDFLIPPGKSSSCSKELNEDPGASSCRHAWHA